MDRLLTASELAAYLGVSIATVRAWRKQGRGPRAIKVERSVRYTETDVKSWLAARADQVPA